MFPRHPLLLLACLLLVPLTGGASPGDSDPRLGAPFVRRDRPSLGSSNAPIVVIEFGNYGCAHCQEFHQRVFPVLRARHIDPGQVQWFLVPGSLEPAGRYHRAFALGRCAEQQGRFWEVFAFLSANARQAPSRLGELVGQLPALDQETFASCMRGRDVGRLVGADFDEFEQLKIKETPTFIVRRLNPDGTRTETRITGLQGADYFQRVFAALLAQP